ncbi:MAG: helix-turn-helix transcriptional regulator [Lachnospiraceae bacterium]|nr:helix-turn-helix transcriptional regulator [Lachnospiraceae bacterium]
MQITELFPSALQLALMEYSDGALLDFMPDFYTSLPDLQEHLLYPCAGGTRQIRRPDSFAFQDVDGYLFLYTKKGQGVLHSEGDSQPLDENSLLLWDCRDYLQLRPVTSEWTVYLLFFYGDAVSVYYEEICKLRFPIFSLSEQSRIADNLRRITELGMTTSPHHAFEENRLLTDILSDLLLDLHMGQSTVKATPPYLLKIRHLFDTEYQREYSVTELAAEAGISRYRLSREFSEYFGQTPVRYLNGVRLSHACTLLETTNLRIHEIASAVGIDSVTHFINLFREKNGMTPAAYRDAYHVFREIEHP